MTLENQNGPQRLTAFLRDQLTADEDFASASARAEIEAKRVIIHEQFRYAARLDDEYCMHHAAQIEDGLCPAALQVEDFPLLLALAIAYADRPGFQPEWAVAAAEVVADQQKYYGTVEGESNAGA